MEKLMRHLLLAFGFTAIVGLASPQAEAAKYVMKLAHNSPVRLSSLYQATALTFQNFLRIYTEGEADVKIFPSSQLGSDPVAAKKVQLGAVEMQIVAGNNISSFDRRIDIFTLPFLFKDFEGATKVFKSDIGRSIREEFRKKTGIRVLGYLAAGFRSMMNSKHPILKPSDLSGLRMRIAKNPISEATYKALGGSAIAISSSELYSALSQKVVDGHDGAIGWSWGLKLHEAQKFTSVTNHQLVTSMFIMNDKYFNSLPEKIRAAVQRAASDALDWGNSYSESIDAFALQDWAKKGLRVDRPDLAPFRNTMKPVYEKFANQVGGMTLINKIIEMQK